MPWRGFLPHLLSRARAFLTWKRLLFAVVGMAIALFSIFLIWMVRYSASIRKLTKGVGDTVFYDARGRAWFRMDEQYRDVPLAEISPLIRNAVIAVEDHRFYRHWAVDFIGIARAVFRDVQSGGVREGGSTLTQQLARTIFLSNQRTWGRKAKEAGIAFLMEMQLSKDQVLELYLNRVFLSAGTYGVEPMSRKLFGKPARNVDLAEAAMLAGLIRAPSALSPWSNLDGAVARSHVVLGTMRKYGFITAQQEQVARAEVPRIQPYPGPTEARWGFAKDYLRQEFRDHFGGEHPPEWKVYTSFLPELQDMAERAVSHGLARLRRPDLQAALVAMDPQTGKVLALVGGRDFRTSQYNRATRSKRQPGSAFKPFVYAAALESGYSPVSVLSGLAQVTAAGPEEWRPRNAHDEGQDELTIREALLESNNRAAIAMEQQIHSGPVLRVAASLGLRGLPDVPSLPLGTGEVTPLDLTNAYAAFVNGGWAQRPRGILEVQDADGEAAYAPDPTRNRVLSEQASFQMVSMLEDVVARGTATGARTAGITFQIGGKTGTTNDFKDAWFVGFSSAVVVGVWVGYDMPATIGRNAYAANVALPIWSEFVLASARLLPPKPFTPPDGLTGVPLCKISYLRPVEECPIYTEFFKQGDDVPDRLCPLHRGTLKQDVKRTVEGVFHSIGRKLRGLFRR